MMSKSASHSIKEEIKQVVGFVGLIWIVLLLSIPLPLADFGLKPRSVSGLVGVVTMPFLHASLGHLLSNTIPLLILLCLLAGSRAKSWEIVIAICVGGGALLWLIGREGNHVGASGLIFGLIAFLILAGLLERRFSSIAVAIVVMVLYGSTLLFGVLPTFKGAVSWEGHLCGAIAGGAVAYVLVKHGDHTGDRKT